MNRVILLVMILAALLISPTAVSQSCQQYQPVRLTLGDCQITTGITMNGGFDASAAHFLPIAPIAAALLAYLYLGTSRQPLLTPVTHHLKPTLPPPR